MLLKRFEIVRPKEEKPGMARMCENADRFVKRQNEIDQVHM